MKYVKTFEFFHDFKTRGIKLPDNIEDLEMETYYLTENGEDVGSMEMDYLEDNDEVYLHSFKIYDEFKGKGYGKKFMIEVLDGLKKYKVKWIGLTVLKTNTVAFKLYESLGFKYPKNIVGYNGHAIEYNEYHNSKPFGQDMSNIVYLIKENV